MKYLRMYWWRIKHIFCKHKRCSISEIAPWDIGNYHLFCDKCGKDLGLIPPW